MVLVLRAYFEGRLAEYAPSEGADLFLRCAIAERCGVVVDGHHDARVKHLLRLCGVNPTVNRWRTCGEGVSRCNRRNGEGGEGKCSHTLNGWNLNCKRDKPICLRAGRWWLVAGGWWLVAGGWWLVAGRWWLVAGCDSELQTSASAAAALVARDRWIINNDTQPPQPIFIGCRCYGARFTRPYHRGGGEHSQVLSSHNLHISAWCKSYARFSSSDSLNASPKPSKSASSCAPISIGVWVGVLLIQLVSEI